MAKPFKLGRIWAVPIEGTYSLAFLTVVLAGVTGWQMRSIVVGYGPGEYALAGIGTAVLFVWTVFAHETAHVLAARHFGARVQGVTLSFLGGRTAISGQPGTPWQGMVVAASGPAASFLCGAGCIGLAFGAAALSVPALIPFSLAWVGLLSLVLGIANLLPAAPLDGGHILQAAAWAKNGNRIKATAIAGAAGRVLGLALFGGAVWVLAQDGSVAQAFAAALFGWPVYRGASATVRVARQRERLAGLTVAGAMKPEPVTIRADLPSADVAGRLRGHDGLVVVVDASGDPVAVMKSTELAVAAQRNSARQVSDAARRARRRLITATSDEPLADVLERSSGKPRAAAVLANGRLAGILDPDLVQVELDAPADQRVPHGYVVVDAWPGARARV